METRHPSRDHRCVEDSFDGANTYIHGQTNVLCNRHTLPGGQGVALETSLQESHYIPLFLTTDLQKHRFRHFTLKSRNVSYPCPHKSSIIANEENVLFSINLHELDETQSHY